jgi:multidrug efflux pump subunit AcrB
MGFIRAALRRPISVAIVVCGIVFASIIALTRMPVDIFPNLNLPVIYVAQPYGGMSPAQMEGYLVYYYEYNFLYIAGIENVESKSIQGIGLIKLTFLPGTDMNQALAQTVAYVNRARAYMPNGTVPPFVLRFDAGSVPVGYLVFSSPTRGVGEIDDLALHRVRPMFATLPGLSAPPPFGGSPRTIIVHADPEKLHSYRMSTDEVVKAITAGNIVLPSGSVRTGEINRITPVNSVVSDFHQLSDLPIRTGSGPTVFLHDIGWIEDGNDISTGYALVNGRRAVFLPVTKRADASTLSVINEVKQNIGRFREAVPADVSIELVFDQSGYVTHALESLIREGLLGALLTGLMILLFLKDWRSSTIVVISIPFALLAAVVGLWLTGQSINIMTLGGMALAVGILVDEATVVIENIHTNLETTPSVSRAVLNATSTTILPDALAMLSILSVFAPSFLMTGVTRALFVPLSLAVGYSMVASFLISNSLVPVLSNWLLVHHRPRTENKAPGRFSFAHFKELYHKALERWLRHRWQVVAIYAVVVAAILGVLGPQLGRELFPRVSAGQFKLHMRGPAGTRIEATERTTLAVLGAIKQAAGADNVDITLSYVGTHPPSYPINNIYIWSGGPHESVMLVALKPDSGLHVEQLEEELRSKLPAKFPGNSFSFEPGDIVSQTMNLGAPTPVEVAVSGPDLNQDRSFAERIREQMRQIPGLRDLQFGQTLNYPSLDVTIDRQRAGQLGVTVEQAAKSLVAATSSSRFVARNFWQDPANGIGYQVQVELPQAEMSSLNEVQNIPLMQGGPSDHPMLGDVAHVDYGNVVGEYDRHNMERMVTLTANYEHSDLGRIASQVEESIRRAGKPPRGVDVNVRGQIAPMRLTLENLGVSLALAIVVIFLLLAANFQSLRLAAVVISTTPAVITGVVIALFVSGTTLNLQSFMGAIMAIGVAVANAILLVTFAERQRKSGTDSTAAAHYGGQSRLRPILMTSLAMVAGMIPMALALGEGAEQTAPLGRAVIGGLAASTMATLFVLPSVFSLVQQNASISSVSLDPDDAASVYKDREEPAPTPSEGDEIL